MYLTAKDEEDLTAREKELLSMMLAQSIVYFPFGKALSLPQSEQNEDMEDMVEKIKNDVEGVKSELLELRKLLELSMTSSDAAVFSLQDLLSRTKEVDRGPSSSMSSQHNAKKSGSMWNKTASLTDTQSLVSAINPCRDDDREK